MAYTNKGKGPYPNKAGEHWGMHMPDTATSPRIAREAYLAQMRVGRPRPCKANTTEELEAQGWVGLYLKADHPLPHGCVQVPTPPGLMEPAPLDPEQEASLRVAKAHLRDMKAGHGPTSGVIAAGMEIDRLTAAIAKAKGVTA